MKNNIYLLGLMLIFLPAAAHAGPIDLLDTGLREAINGGVAVLQTTAIKWLSAFILLQFLMTNIGLLKSGADIEAVFGKLMGSLVWFGVCFYIISNGTDFIDKVSKGFFQTAGDISGAGQFNAAYIIDQGAVLAGNLLGKINQASGITDLFLPAILGGLLGCVIIATSALIAFKVFLIKIEAMLVIMISPLSFSFLGLNALKDQGIAPFKSLISLLYRTLLLALILKTMGGISDNLVKVINSITTDSIDGIWSVLFAAVIAYALLGYIAYRSDSIASNIASGGTSMGTADVGIGAAAGGAAGGVIGGAIGAMAGGAAKIGQPMSDVIKNMMGAGGGSMANESRSGIGGASPAGDAPPVPPKAPEMSVADNNAMRMAAGPELTGTPASSPSSMSERPSLADRQAAMGKSSGGDSSATSPSGTGSGANAGIGGAEGATNEKLDKLMDSMGQTQKPSLKDRMSDLNSNVIREQATTHVSINTNAAD